MVCVVWSVCGCGVECVVWCGVCVCGVCVCGVCGVVWCGVCVVCVCVVCGVCGVVWCGVVCVCVVSAMYVLIHALLTVCILVCPAKLPPIDY